MRIRRPFLLGLSTVAVGIGVTAVTLTSAAAKPQDLTVTTTATAINDIVDDGPAGPSPGDIYVCIEDVWNASNTKIGSAEGRCNLTDPTKAHFECAIVTDLPGGSITTEGILINQQGATSTGAITGGTGSYAGATGEGTLVLGGPTGPHTVTFHFTGPA